MEPQQAQETKQDAMLEAGGLEKVGQDVAGPQGQVGAAQKDAAQESKQGQDAVLDPAVGLSSERFKGRPVFESVVAGQLVLSQGYPNASVVRAVQGALKQLSYYASEPDGMWGPMTNQALVAFKSSQKMESQQPVLDATTLLALDKQDSAAGGKPDEAKATPATENKKAAEAETPEAKAEEKKAEEEDAAAPVSKLDPAVEAEFANRAQVVLTELEKKPATAIGGGDSKAGAKVPAFPDWFSALQAALINRTTWGEVEESGRTVLKEYATARAHATGKPVPEAILYFFQFLGNSEANQKAAKKAGKNHSGELTGGEGASDWCAAAGTIPMIQSLANRGLRPTMETIAWLGKLSGYFKDKGGIKLGPSGSNAAEMRCGDMLSFVSASSHKRGHWVTVFEAAGDNFTCISGNAGGGGGSVRMDQYRRDTNPPAAYNYEKVISGQMADIYRPKQGDVWLISMIRASALYEAVDQLLALDPSSPEYQSMLQKLHLTQAKK